MFRRFLVFLSAVTVVYFQALSQSQVVPAVRSWKPAGGTLTFAKSFPLVISPTAGKDFLKGAQLFSDELATVSQLSPKVVSSNVPRKGGIFFTIAPLDSSFGKEGYKLDIGETGATVKAQSTAGLFYGMQTLLQVFKQTGNNLEKGTVADFPSFEMRGIMIDVGRKFFEVEYLENTIRQLAWYKMNMLHLHFTEWSAFRLKSDKFPGLAAKEAYSKEDIRRLQDFAKQYHVMIVPEIDLPAHATAISEFDPSLGFKCESMRKARWQGEEANNAGKAWTLDVTRPEVRKFIKELLDEFIPLFDAPYFHVGGDEYQYDPEKWQCPELVEAMKVKGYTQPGDIFIDWLNEVNEQVKSYGKQTQIWSWWSFHKNKTSIHPSKDIIVNVWNKPNQQEIVKDGYKVIITPEEDLYVSPGLVDTTGYGVVDCRGVYEEWVPEKNTTILGYKVCIWADRAEIHTDSWFEGHAFEPKVVLAEKVWAGAASKNLKEFLQKVNQCGFPPRIFKSYPQNK